MSEAATLALSLLCLLAVAYSAGQTAVFFLGAMATGWGRFWWPVRSCLSEQRT